MASVGAAVAAKEIVLVAKASMTNNRIQKLSGPNEVHPRLE